MVAQALRRAARRRPRRRRPPTWSRLEKALGPLEVDLELLRELPRRLREADFRGTAVLADGRLMDFEPGNTEWDAYAVAVDVGTTTLAAALLDLATGRELAVAVAAESADPLRRRRALAHPPRPRTDPRACGKLQQAVAAAVDEMIGELCRAGRRRPRADLRGHLLRQHHHAAVALRRRPAAAGRGAVRAGRPAGASSLPAGRARAAHPSPRPGLRPAGDRRLRRRRHRGRHPGHRAGRLPGSRRCLVDIGTNGEIVLCGRRADCSAASTAAGPAFEGARISHGMRASAGAIEKVVVDGRLRINVIGNVPPVGLCGSALIDAAAELLRHGMLTPAGPAARRPTSCPPACRPTWRRRIVLDDGQAGLRAGRRGRGGRRPADPAHPARRPRAATGHRGDPRGHRHPACAGPAWSRRTSTRARRRRLRQFHPPQQRPADRAVAAARSSTAGSATRATPRWPGRGWRPFRSVPAALADELARADRARRSLARPRLPLGLRRGDGLSGGMR